LDFVDEVSIRVEAGDGGGGIVAWHREKFVEFGGPSGGDGGRGGSVFVEANHNLSTLLDLRYKKVLKAERGRDGGGKNMHGRSGKDAVISVPVGTQIFDTDKECLLVDLVEDGERYKIAQGGRGGRGNARFVTSTNRAPKYSEEGRPGQHRGVRMELKLLADVGLIGYPSVGKSTIISVISEARPRIAAYPFTTLAPNLGVVQLGRQVTFVVADIPGLIEGASDGKGLGHQFLRHVERCLVLVHVLEVPPPFDDGSGVPWTDRSPLKDFARLNRELERFNPALATRPQIVALNKADLPWVKEQESSLRDHFTAKGIPFVSISAVARQGLGELIAAMAEQLGTEVSEDW
jgi:GTP-binding protein